MSQKSSKSSGSVKIQLHEKVATITFSHPKGNSLPSTLLQKIADHIQTCSIDKDVDVILLQSEGEKAFCGGASFEELTAVKTLEESKSFFGGFADIIIAMGKSPKIIITRVHGKVVGGGVGIVAASDYVLANKQAQLRLSELTLGIGPFIIAPAIERKIGIAHATKLTLSTEWYSARWAHEQGLYAEIFPNIMELDNGVRTFLKKVKSFNPKALAEYKKTLWANQEDFEKKVRARVETTAKLAIEEFTQSKVQQLLAKSRK